MAGLGQTAGYQGGHCPQDHGFVAGREASVVADRAAVLADPGGSSFFNPAVGKTSKARRLRRTTIWSLIFRALAQEVSLPV
jgi:hypothetical protein